MNLNNFLAILLCLIFFYAADLRCYAAMSKDTVKNNGMLIYDEDTDSVIYNTNAKTKDNTVDKKTNNNENSSLEAKYLAKLKLAQRLLNNKDIADLADSLVAYFNKIGDFEKATYYIEISIKAKEAAGNRRSAAGSYSSKASTLFNSGKYDESIEAYKKAISLLDELKDKETESMLLKELAQVYNYTYQFDEAAKSYHRAIDLKKELNDKRGLTTLINDIGNLYFENNRLDQAISFFQQNLETEKSGNDKANIAASCNNIGIAYFQKGDYQRAENMFNRALEIYKELNDKKGVSTATNNLANLFGRTNKDKAMEYYESSIKIKAELKDEEGIALLKYNIGMIYKDKGDKQKAMTYFSESAALSKKKDLKDLYMNNIFAMSRLHAQNSNYKSAYDLFEQFVDLKQLLSAEDKEAYHFEVQEKYTQEREINRLSKKLSKQDLLTRVVLERNKQELRIRDLELAKIEEEVKNQRFITLFSLIILLIIGGFLFFIFRQFKKLKKANNLLTRQKALIENKNSELLSVNDELNKLSIVAREIENGVVIMDKDGKFEWVNEGFTRLYGYTLESLISKRGTNLISASENPNVKIAVMSCMKQKISVRYETQYPDVNGKKIWTQTTLTPILGSDGNISKIIAIDSDITKFKNAEFEILQQKELLENQRDEIKKQRDIATRQRDEISHQKEEITDGIIYAEHIQHAILPPESYIKERLHDHFILFLPRDIISGDFYWVRRLEHKIVFTAADCTGHGTPAAMMSMLGSALLNEILNNYLRSDLNSITPADILNQLRQQVISSLHQTGKIGGLNDGMDMSLCILDTQTLKLQYAGANSPVYIVPVGSNIKDRKFPDEAVPFGDDLPGIELKPDKMPIGIHPLAVERNFTNLELQLYEGDIIYLFSDGYIDQFGGPKYVKYRANRFKKSLIDIHNEPMDVQQKLLYDIHKNWRGNMEQIDDILIFGVKV